MRTFAVLHARPVAGSPLSGWRWNWSAPASQQQIRSVLANPTGLEIRGEYPPDPMRVRSTPSCSEPAGELVSRLRRPAVGRPAAKLPLEFCDSAGVDIDA